MTAALESRRKAMAEAAGRLRRCEDAVDAASSEASALEDKADGLERRAAESREAAAGDADEHEEGKKQKKGKTKKKPIAAELEAEQAAARAAEAGAAEAEAEAAECRK